MDPDDAALLAADRNLWPASWSMDDRRARLIRLAGSRRTEADLGVLDAVNGHSGAFDGGRHRVAWARVRPNGGIARYEGHGDLEYPPPPLTAVCAIEVGGRPGFVSGCEGSDAGIRVWFTDQAHAAAAYDDLDDDVSALAALDFFGQRAVAVALDDGTVELFSLAGDLDDLEPAVTLEVGARVAAMCAVPGDEGDRLVCGDDSGVVTVWEAAEGEELHRFQAHDAPVTGLWTDGDGLLVTADGTGELAFWSVDGSEERRRLDAHDGAVMRLCGWPVAGGYRLATLGSDRAVVVRDAATGAETARIDLRGLQVAGLHAVPAGDGARLATVGDRVTWWDPETGARIGAWGRRALGDAACVVPFAGRPMLVVCHDDGLRVYDPADPDLPAGDEAVGRIDALCLLDGGLLAGAGGDTVHLWAADSGEELHRLRVPGELFWNLCVTGGLLAAGGRDGVVRLLDPATANIVREFAGHPGGAYGLCPAGDLVAVAGGDATVRLLDPATGAAVRVLECAGTAYAIGAVPVGGSTVLAAATVDAVELWDPATGSPLGTLPANGLNGLRAVRIKDRVVLAAVSNDYDAGSAYDAVSLWDLERFEMLGACAGQIVESVGVAPVEVGGVPLVATPHEDTWHSVTLWDPAAPGYPEREIALFAQANTVLSPAPGRLAIGLENGVIVLQLTEDATEHAT